jgi:hypothetical protein
MIIILVSKYSLVTSIVYVVCKIFFEMHAFKFGNCKIRKIIVEIISCIKIFPDVLSTFEVFLMKLMFLALLKCS